LPVASAVITPNAFQTSMNFSDDAVLGHPVEDRVVGEEADVVDVDGLEYLGLELFRLAYHLVIRSTDIKHK
jgi:hypothetical protein